MGALRIDSILAVMLFLGILSSVASHNTLRSYKPLSHMKSFSRSSLESWDSPVANVPKYLNRAEAERVSAARWKLTRSLAAAPRIDNATVQSKGRVLYVTNYGADPTGGTDSTQAILAAINETFNVATSKQTMPGVRDLGGVEIHLEGGNYLISGPLRLPRSGGGNVLIHGGTLRASEDFPMDRYLIELWSSNDATHRSVSYEDITMRDLMLDANFEEEGFW